MFEQKLCKEVKHVKLQNI